MKQSDDTKQSEPQPPERPRIERLRGALATIAGAEYHADTIGSAFGEEVDSLRAAIDELARIARPMQVAHGEAATTIAQLREDLFELTHHLEQKDDARFGRIDAAISELEARRARG